MLFTNVKRKAEEGLSREQIEYRERYQETLSSAEVLLDTRYEAVQLLHECEEYLQMISNHPYTYDLKRSKVYKEYQAFEKQLKKYKPHKNKAEFLLGGRKALGAGSVLLGPNAMLAAVTTFGLTPTSAVLGLLDGTATVNAALTWLCGGLAEESWWRRCFLHWLALSAWQWGQAVLRRTFSRRITRRKYSRRR